MQKKVLHLFRNLKYGGNQVLALDLIKNSSSIFAHSILSLHHDLEMETEFQALGCTIKVIPHKEYSFNEFKQLFTAYVKENSYTTIVTWFYPYVLKLNISNVNFVHHIGTAPVKKPLLQWLKNLAYVKIYGDNQGKFVFASRHIQNQNRVVLGAKFNNSQVILNGIDTARFSAKNGYARGNAYTITMVGRLDGSKDFDTLIQIAEELSFSIPNLKIQIVGDGVDRRRLEKLSIEHNATKIVSFLGRRTDIPEILKQSDLCVFLNKPLEGFGLVIVEAMSVGLPVITYDLGANSEIITKGIDGFLVTSRTELIEKICSLFNSIQLSQKLGLAARETARTKFDVKKMVRKYEELY